MDQSKEYNSTPRKGSAQEHEGETPNAESRKRPNGSRRPQGKNRNKSSRYASLSDGKQKEQSSHSGQRSESGNRRAPQQRHGKHPKVDVSIIVPLYNEEESLPELSEQIIAVMATVSPRWEVWFVDDGSTDTSYKILQGLYRKDARFKTIRFRRNYGKSAALAVGFERARGKYVITMDADLQDDPAEIPALIEQLESGYDMVSGWKKKRYDPITKTLPSKLFNYVTSLVSGLKLHDFNCGLKGYKNDVVKTVRVYGEMHRYIPVLAKMSGFSVTEIPVHHHPRKYGKTKFGLSRFYKGFLDLLTVYFVSKYTTRPLHIFGSTGVVLFGLGLLINAWLTVEWLMGFPMGDRPMLMLGVLLMLVGIQLVSTGLLAEMITNAGQHSNDYGIKTILQ